MKLNQIEGVGYQMSVIDLKQRRGKFLLILTVHLCMSGSW
jgi:hypothetical protein